MRKSIAIFGSTGSIGIKAVELITQNLDKYNVQVVTAYNNFKLLATQAKKIRAKKAVIVDETCYCKLKQLLSRSDVEVSCGYKALIEHAKLKVDINFMMIVGIAGLEPTLEAVKSANTLAIANKESLVCGGNLINKISPKATIIPIDSEHNAIFQVLTPQVDKITLTASGGPFYRKKTTDITIDQVINHPIWKMGKKISVDSATMMNKVLEVIEGHYLFGRAIDDINILIHPEAIIHGMVSYIDGNTVAVLSKPDMIIPIAYALHWPKRQFINRKLDLIKNSPLSFHEADINQFPALKFLSTNNYVALNAANEVAVKFFLNKKIPFHNIIPIIDNIISRFPSFKTNSVEEILDYNKFIQNITEELILCKA